MKSKNLFYLFLSSILLFTGFSSCNDGVDVLSLGYSEVYAKLNEDVDIFIYSGNGGYTLKEGNKKIFTASENNSLITVKPLKVGRDTLTVTDKENQVANIFITVREPYMALGVAKLTIENTVNDAATQKTIQENIEKNMIFKEGYLYDLTKNASRPFTSYKGFWGSSPETTGTYAFANDSLKLSTASANFGYIMEQTTESKIFYDYFVTDKPAKFTTLKAVFKLTADLTENYKKQFPDKGVQSVKVTAVAEIVPYRYTIAY